MNKTIISGAVLALLATSFNGCGETTSTNGEEPKAKIDFAEYFEKSDQVINRVSIESNTKEKTSNHEFYKLKVVVKDNIITYEVKDKIELKVTIANDEVNLTFPTRPSDNITRKRQLEIGEILSSSGSDRIRTINGIKYESKKLKTCKIEAKINSFEIDPKLWDQKYAGDIIVEACTTTEEITIGDESEPLNLVEIDRTYFQKGKGVIAIVHDHCFIEKPILHVNDNSKECAYRISEIDALVE
jgi:hypothetical protein